jgi:hypothetical protein
MKTCVHLVLVLGMFVVLHNRAEGRSDSASISVRGGDIEINVPGFCSTINNGEFPGALGQKHDIRDSIMDFIVKTSYVYAFAPDRDFFITAYCEAYPYTADIHMEELNDGVKSILARKSVMEVQTSPSNSETLWLSWPSSQVCQYKVLGQVVREVTAKALKTRQQYKLFVVIGTKRVDAMLRLFKVVVGCRNNEISEYDRLMNVILSSFTVR